MINTNDIYIRMSDNLIKKGYFYATTNEKLELLNEELTNYIISKIKELDPHYIYDNEDICSLITTLYNSLFLSNKVETLNQIIHYILKVASNIQGYDIIWWIEKDQKFIQEPICEFNKKGLWDSIKTHNDTNIIQTFSLAYKTLNNNFSNKDKKLIKNKTF